MLRNVNFSKFMNTYTGKILMSIILGFGLATLFRSMCNGKQCIITKAPPFDEINGKIYKFDDKCYKFKQKAVKCDTNKNIIDFA